MMSELEIFTDIPDSAGHLEKEMDAYKILKELDIPFVRTGHPPAMTIEDCHNVDVVLGTPLCKNLFLTNSAKTEYFLLLMPGEKSFRTKDVSKEIGSSRLSFGSYEKMEEMLNLTPGSVTITGLMYDKEHKVRLLIDRELLNNEYLCFHPNINTASVKAKTEDMLGKFLKYTGHEPTFVG